jgi:periplasmic copper chaperone A
VTSGAAASVTSKAAVAAAAVTALALTLTGCGGSGGSGSGSSGGSNSSGPRLSVSSAYIPRPVSDSMAAGFLTIVNDGGSVAWLASVTSDDADRVTVHRSADGRMEAAGRLGIPAHGRLVLASGENHLMFEKLSHRLEEGETVPVRLHFADAAPITVRMPVKAATYRPGTTGSGN